MNAQTPASVFNGPEHWRQRAEEARRMADLMSNIPSKEAMLRIAEDYEHLAEWAEERAKRKRSGNSAKSSPAPGRPPPTKGGASAAIRHCQ
jgi:hypothetical protein